MTGAWRVLGLLVAGTSAWMAVIGYVAVAQWLTQ